MKYIDIINIESLNKRNKISIFNVNNKNCHNDNISNNNDNHNQYNKDIQRHISKEKRESIPLYIHHLLSGH